MNEETEKSITNLVQSKIGRFAVSSLCVRERRELEGSLSSTKIEEEMP